jgi:hypothetical protein
MSGSSNLNDWSLLASRSIPRARNGTNSWVHTNAFDATPARFYRPVIEIAP